MATGVEVDTLQGTLGSVWFHLDLTNDVLYFRDHGTRCNPVFGEETPEGFTVMRAENGKSAGMTIVNYWGRFGVGDLSSASIQTVKERVAAWIANHPLAE